MRKTSSRPQRDQPDPPPILHANLPILETADPFLLAEIKADPRLGPLILAELSDRVAVIHPGSGDAFLRQLLKSGHTPRVQDT
jgi:hypothetical protein